MIFAGFRPAGANPFFVVRQKRGEKNAPRSAARLRRVPAVLILRRSGPAHTGRPALDEPQPVVHDRLPLAQNHHAGCCKGENTEPESSHQYPVKRAEWSKVARCKRARTARLGNLRQEAECCRHRQAALLRSGTSKRRASGCAFLLRFFTAQ